MVENMLTFCKALKAVCWIIMISGKVTIGRRLYTYGEKHGHYQFESWKTLELSLLKVKLPAAVWVCE